MQGEPSDHGAGLTPVKERGKKVWGWKAAVWSGGNPCQAGGSPQAEAERWGSLVSFSDGPVLISPPPPRTLRHWLGAAGRGGGRGWAGVASAQMPRGSGRGCPSICFLHWVLLKGV